MKKQILSICMMMLPVLCYGHSMQDNPGANDQYQETSNEMNDNQETNEWGYVKKTKDPEARAAFRRGQEDYKRHLNENREPSGRYSNENQDPNRPYQRNPPPY